MPCDGRLTWWFSETPSKPGRSLKFDAATRIIAGSLKLGLLLHEILRKLSLGAAVVGVILVAILSVGPAGISAVIDVSDILGKSVDGEDVTTLDEGIVE
jgi:hypothetical protein